MPPPRTGYVLPTPESVLCWGIDAGPFGIIKDHFSSNGSAELWRMPHNYENPGGNIVQTWENAIAAVAILASGSAIASLGTAHAATGNAVLEGSIPAWANSKNLVGTADPGGDVGFRVYLGWSNDSAVQALASAVSDPSSSTAASAARPALNAPRKVPLAGSCWRGHGRQCAGRGWAAILRRSSGL